MNAGPNDAPRIENTGGQHDERVLGPNVYRDGGRLVVNIHDEALAPICIGSGLPADDFLSLNSQLTSGSDMLLRAVIGNGLLSRAFTSDPDKVELKVPVNQSWLAEAKRQTWKSYLVVGVGGLTALGGIGLSLVNELFVVVGLVVCVATLIYAIAIRRSTLKLSIAKKKRDWVWLDGTDSAVLKAHPELRTNKKLEFLTYR